MPDTAVGEDRRDSETVEVVSVDQWWLAWVSGPRCWVLGSSKAANVACSAVLDVNTVR